MASFVILLIACTARIACSDRQTYIYTYGQTHETTTVTLSAHAHRGLIKIIRSAEAQVGIYMYTRYTHQRRCLAQTIATKGSCMPNLRGIHHGDPLHVQVIIIIIIILRMRRSVTDIYIYIYIYPSREPSAQS